MNSFEVADIIEGQDDFGVWARGRIAALQEGNLHVSFDSFGRKWDMCLTEERIRADTVIDLPKNRSRQPKIVSFILL